ncbi:Crp/Fnr family transcriptional regulator [Sphingomonas faeni]|uniref:Crp/Fnr family transcriptional regulator n=1 Tax=Sphingomonas faeni TaxID=185950 RepID=UPI00278B318E|nr:Crp/Fnr family transcriptional regulator [Sphingomonas faeni]MDQ0839429.1 CRP-like cAMP-binding protein [Sphingomonas faeni]
MIALADTPHTPLERSGFRPARHLRDTELCRSPFLAAKERRALEQSVTWSKRFDPQKDLICEATNADDLLIVASGWAYRYSCVADGGRQLTGLVVPGEVANLDTLLFDQVSYSVRTLTEATIVALPRSQALALADTHPGIARTFTGMAMVENAISRKWIVSLGRRPARARIAHLLCEIGIRLGVEDDTEITFPFPLRQEQIGDVLGLTNVHVNRMIRQLLASGLIQLSDRVLTIPDVAALRYVAGFDPSYLHMDRVIDSAARPIAEPI